MAPSSLSASTTSTSCVSATSTTGLYLPQTYSFLTPETFETLVEGYISQLHIRKRNKALISQQLANDCLMVLTNPENTAIFNPKFRWWVRKHFVFTVVGELRILMDKKNGKPVCVREQLYDKVCYFHHIIGHGGRDKTFAAITKSYSKVPAELVSLFTKNCQTCLGVRKYSKNKRPILNEFEYTGQHQHSAQTHHSQRQQQQQQQQQLQQQQHSQQHHQQYIQQPHPSHQTHPHHLQLTCNTSFFSSNAHHQQQQQQPQQQQNPYSMLTKMEHGIMSPISPLLNHSGSSFFGSTHLQPTYHTQSQSEQQQQQQPSQQPHQDQQHQPHHPSQQMHQQQMQQHHHAALATHLNMSMSLSGMSLGGHLDTSSSTNSSGTNSTNSNGLSVTTTTPTIITKMDIPFHQLMQQQQSHNNAHQLINTGLHSPTDLQDHPFASHHHHPHQHQHQQHQQQSSPAPSIDCYSPTLQQHYMPQQQHSQHSQQQHQQQQNDIYSDSFSSYSAALALNNFQHQPTYPAHETSSSSSSQLDQDEDPSPLLNSTQMFQKQIQQEHYQYQQQQHQQQQHPRSFLEESLLATHLTASTSSAHSAVPSMSHCAEMCSAETLSSIPTPMSCSSSSPLTSMLESHGHHPHPNHHDLDQSDAADLDLDQNHGLQQQQQHQQQQHQQHHQDLMAMEQQYRELAAVSKHELQGLHHALQPRQDDDDDDEAEGDDNNKEETISMEKCQLISAVADLVAQI